VRWADHIQNQVLTVPLAIHRSFNRRMSGMKIQPKRAHKYPGQQDQGTQPNEDILEGSGNSHAAGFQSACSSASSEWVSSPFGTPRTFV
jgi:hypothetical protein